MRSQNHLRLSREELYQLVWSKPMQHLAKDYGISDRAIAKVCFRKQVPVPPRGYWAKKLAGGSVAKPLLPKFIDKIPKKESKIDQNLAIRENVNQKSCKKNGKGNTKIRNPFEERDREVKSKLKEFHRSMSEDVYYVMKIEDWKCDYTFGLNTSYNPLRKRDIASFMHDEPHEEYRTLSVKGVFLKPVQLKGQNIGASFSPSVHLNESKRKENQQWYKENPPQSVGVFQKEKERIWGIISLPADAMNLVLKIISACKINFITFDAEKLRYGRADIHRYSFREKHEDS